MTRRKSVRAPQQASLLEAMLLGSEQDTAPVEPATVAPKADVSPAVNELANSEKADRDLFAFILELSEPHAAKDFWMQSSPSGGDVEQTATVLMTVDALQATPNALAIARASADEVAGVSNAVGSDAPRDDALTLTPSWLLEHFAELVARIADVWIMLREREGLESLNSDTAQQHVASLLCNAIQDARTLEDVENELSGWLQDLTKFAQRLYGCATQENQETIQSLVNRFMQHALRERIEDAEWVRAVFEAGARKMLSGKSQHIYSAIVVSVLQRQFRKAVRELLEANTLPLPAYVLARARQNGYRNMMREDLQSLARAGLTLQSASVGWLKAQVQGEQQQEVLWKARRGDSAAIMIQGYTVLNERVLEHPDAVLTIVFKCGRAQEHYSLPRDDWEKAKRLLWAKGFRAEDEEGFPIPENVTRLWEDYFEGREYGWWYGDEAGRVIVVMRYNAARKIRNYERLRRAAAKMRTWNYCLRYSDDALYFLPPDIDLPPRGETDDYEPDEEDDNNDVV